MRVPSLGVAPTLPFLTCVLRAQSTNTSFNVQLTELARAHEDALLALMLDDFALDIQRSRVERRAGPIRYDAASRQHGVVQAMDRAVESFGLSGNGGGGRAVRTSAASSGTKSCLGKSAGRAPRLLGWVWP
jgi:hypothetical protein